jgi:hypothetical protein
MLNDVYQAPRFGLEDMHQDLRQCTCECGCGEAFYQKRIGRVRKYMNNSHKAAAYRNQKADKASKPLIGDTVKELLDYMDGVIDVEHSLDWLDADERYAIQALATLPKETRIALCAGLNGLFGRYCS